MWLRATLCPCLMYRILLGLPSITWDFYYQLCFYVCFFLCISISLYICLSLLSLPNLTQGPNLHTGPSTHLPICLPAHLPACLTAHLPYCPPAQLPAPLFLPPPSLFPDKKILVVEAHLWLNKRFYISIEGEASEFQKKIEQTEEDSTSDTRLSSVGTRKYFKIADAA
jgi:hypothetical protein